MSVLCDLLFTSFKHSWFLYHGLYNVHTNILQPLQWKWLKLHLSSTDGYLNALNEAFEEIVYHQVSLRYSMSYIFFPESIVLE